MLVAWYLLTYRTLMSPSRFMLQEDIEDDLCSDDPWLVLHKIDSPTKMRFVGNKVAQCDRSTLDPTKVAASLAHYIGAQGDITSFHAALWLSYSAYSA